MSKSYSAMTVPERWQWHAEVYGFRRVCLGIQHDEHTSPVDPTGEWFDGPLADAAEARLRQQYAETSRNCSQDTKARNAIRFADAEQWRQSPAGRAFLRGLHQSAEPRARFNPHDAAAALGVKACEYSPTAEQLAAGRREIGLDDGAASAA